MNQCMKRQQGIADQNYTTPHFQVPNNAIVSTMIPVCTGRNNHMFAGINQNQIL